MSISCKIVHVTEGNITTKDTGLGNTLFQLATQYSYSKKYGFSMNIHELRLYCDKY